LILPPLAWVVMRLGSIVGYLYLRSWPTRNLPYYDHRYDYLAGSSNWYWQERGVLGAKTIPPGDNVLDHNVVGGRGHVANSVCEQLAYRRPRPQPPLFQSSGHQPESLAVGSALLERCGLLVGTDARPGLSPASERMPRSPISSRSVAGAQAGSAALCLARPSPIVFTVLAVVVDGALETFVEADCGVPAQDGLRLGAVSNVVPDLDRFGGRREWD
jgi:hypothetical protein